MFLEDFEDVICEQRTGKECIRSNENYLSNYDIIYFPIKQDEEFSLGVLDVPNFTIKHYFLNQRITQPVSSLQQIFKAWNIRDHEYINEIQIRQDQQHRYLQYLIYWVRRQAQIHQISKISDMKLWKIRIEDINTVSTVQETGMYLLLIITHMCIQSRKYNPNNLVIIREILENIICTMGIQDKTSNKYAIEYFSKKIVNLIK
ncbi:hypothetical protein FGO68_gene17810 [Halteria grandinella]|uniref:Uncharacterized protein n=1 Tax=Halteria grandinella TaxID=5974 RepID=A0A8J8SXS7_HALGN|nr:hypothetical protein FGO68_gene17810 [Halteria grandinella]